MSDVITVKMKKAKETKHTFRYEETKKPILIGTLYVPKTTLQAVFKGAPEEVIVKVEA